MKHSIFLACLFTLIISAQAKESVKPNIIIILADDLGYGDVQALNPDGKILTPCLDSLTAGGMFFRDMHSPSSVCTPTRYGILTGRYCWRSPLKSGVLYGYDPPLIEADRPTLPAMLRECGYHTAAVGKWHLGLAWAEKNPREKKGAVPEENVDFSRPFAGGPTELGFDYFFGISASLDMPPYVYLENDRVVKLPETRKTWIREGAAATDFEAEDVLPKITEKAVAYIDSRAEDAKNGKPFFLYFALTSPHTPILPTEEWRGKSGLNPYADFVMQTDAVVGKIMETLAHHGLTENTLLIFASDNGCSPQADFPTLWAKGHDPNAGFRGAKADIFDGGHRIPFIVRWPGKIREGSASDQLGCLTDFMATFAAVTGCPLPNTAEDSVNLLPAMLETADAPLRTEVVHHSINGSFAIRQGDWKLCLCPDSGGWSAPTPGSVAAKNLPPVQLYNMRTDVAEKENLQGENREKVEEMTRNLESRK